jgi:hypothetical protein
MGVARRRRVTCARTASVFDRLRSELVGLLHPSLHSLLVVTSPPRHPPSLGDEALGVPCDDEAREIWLQYLPANRVMPFDIKDNFWEMGERCVCGCRSPGCAGRPCDSTLSWVWWARACVPPLWRSRRRDNICLMRRLIFPAPLRK